MYRVFILDDEKIVRLALKNMIEWEPLGFKITGSFGSASSALGAMKSMPPDLIITDIAMPDMDGLQFIRQVRAMQLECPIIVLTNHKNFSFAVSAIRQGVMDYVIKTDISPELLTVLLEKARAQLENHPNSTQDIVQDNPWERDRKKLEDAIKGSGTPVQQLEGRYFFCMAFLEPNEGQPPEREFYHFLSENSGADPSHLILCGSSHVLILLNIQRRLDFAAQCQRLCELSKVFLNRACGFLLSEWFDNTADFKEEYILCGDNVRQMLFRGDGEPLLSSDLRQIIDNPLPINSVCDSLLQTLDQEDYSAAERILTDFLQSSLYANTVWQEQKNALCGICFSMLLERSAFLQREVREERWQQLRCCRTQADYSAFFRKELEEDARIKENRRLYARRSEISSIISFIEENLKKHISLKMLSDHVHMTENYISRLFKSETGMNAINYINSVKMREAARLLQTPENTVTSAAMELGFYEPSYFIRLFRRIYGIGPSEYKRFIKNRAAEQLLYPDGDHAKESDGDALQKS